MALNEKLTTHTDVPGQITDMVEELGTASRLPNLSRDVAALLAILFLIITYHIQHPFMLFRVEFGQTFRDVQEQGFQEAMVYALLASVALMARTWQGLWSDRDQTTRTLGTLLLGVFAIALLLGEVAQLLVPGLLVSVVLIFIAGRHLWGSQQRPHDRLRLAIIIGLALYILHILFIIFRDHNLFVDLYDLDPEMFADTLQMRRSEAATFADRVKALNSIGLVGGVGLASIIYLWAPWELVRYVRRDTVATAAQKMNRLITDVIGIAAVGLWFITYRLLNPLWLDHSAPGRNLADSQAVFGFGLLLAVGALVFMQLRLRTPGYLRDILGAPRVPDMVDKRRVYWRLKIALAVGAVLYAIYVGLALIADYGVVQAYYNVESSSFAELFALEGIVDPLKVTDIGAVLAGIALISTIYFWAPWERLMIYADIIRQNITAVVVAILAVAAWEYGVEAFNIQQFLLPKPSAIWETFEEIYPGLIAGSWFTIQNAIKGFAVGCGAGILTGIFSARFIRFSKAILPLAVAANAVPIIAFAPIANAWFGLTNPDAKIAIVAVLCYFPAMISTVQGLTSVEPRELELMKSYAASEFEIFRHLRWPTALPFVFSALKLAATLAMIGAIVAEFFGGTPATALGFRIKNDAGLLRMTESWSAIIIASALGIGFFLFISALERNMMPWYGSFRSDTR